MAVIGMEWIAVAVIILVLLIYGPEKLPKLARALGAAKREYEKAARELAEMYYVKDDQFSGKSTPYDEALIKAARALGIETQGKTREQIVKEISEKAKEHYK